VAFHVTRCIYVARKIPLRPKRRTRGDRLAWRTNLGKNRSRVTVLAVKLICQFDIGLLAAGGFSVNESRGKSIRHATRDTENSSMWQSVLVEKRPRLRRFSPLPLSLSLFLLDSLKNIIVVTSRILTREAFLVRDLRDVRLASSGLRSESATRVLSRRSILAMSAGDVPRARARARMERGTHVRAYVRNPESTNANPNSILQLFA